jgi:ribonuclease-3 family protein
MFMDKNVLVLAYLGDSIYEIYIRTFLIDKGISKVKELQKEAVKYVSASSQEKFLKKMIESHFLIEEELDIVYRARNHKVNHKPKNASIVTYKYATGLEALIGYLYLEKKKERIVEITDFIVRED